MDFLKSHKQIYTYPDNDEAGRKVTELIQSVNANVYNRSTKYADYQERPYPNTAGFSQSGGKLYPNLN